MLALVAARPGRAARRDAAAWRSCAASSARAALVVVVGALGLVASGRQPVHAGPPTRSAARARSSNDPGRLGSLETNNRTVWWGEAWQVFRATPPGGTGAQTFEIARKRFRDDAAERERAAQRAAAAARRHGPAGVRCSALALVVGLVLGLRATLRRLERGRARGRGRPRSRCPLAFGLHALVDYDLDFLAVAAPTALVSAALLGAGRPAAARAQRAARRGRRGRRRRLAAVWVLVAPALATRSVDAAYRQIDAGDLVGRPPRRRAAPRASTRSRPSRSTRGRRSRTRAGDNGAAEAFYEQATRLQPENPATWYELGLFRQLALGDQCGAYYALNAAYTLDPKQQPVHAGRRRSTSPAARSTIRRTLRVRAVGPS